MKETNIIEKSKKDFSNKFNYEMNNVIGMCIVEDLTDYEKGEIYLEFIAKHKLSQVQLSEHFKKRGFNIHRKKINRCCFVYNNLNKVNNEIKEIINGFPDRIKGILLRLDSKKKINFVIENKKGLSTGEIESVVSVLSNNKPIEDFEKNIKEKYKKKLELIKTIKKFMKK